MEEALEICDWCEGVLTAYAKKPEYTTDTLPWVLKKFNFSKMSAYLKAGKEAEAKEVCNTYLAEIKEKKVFSEEEYLSVEKEFKEKIYIL